MKPLITWTSEYAKAIAAVNSSCSKGHYMVRKKKPLILKE